MGGGRGGTESPRPGGARSRVAQPGTCVGIIVVQRGVANRNANDKPAACFLSSVATPANTSFKSQKQCDWDGREARYWNLYLGFYKSYKLVNY